MKNLLMVILSLVLNSSVFGYNLYEDHRHWDKPIRWKVYDSSTDYSAVQYKDMIKKAFDYWNVYTGLDIQESTNDKDANVFIAKLDPNGNKYLAETAHSVKNGVIGISGISLYQNISFKVILHEVGHVLGMDHSNNQAAVMYFAAKWDTISKDDADGIAELYGKSYEPQFPIEIQHIRGRQYILNTELEGMFQQKKGKLWLPGKHVRLRGKYPIKVKFVYRMFEQEITINKP